MKKILTIINFIFIISIISCSNQPSAEKLHQMIAGNDATQIIEAYYIIGENKKTEFIEGIFKDPYDPRISHHLRFKGISVYQSKMGALRKISELEPPNKITYKTDTIVVKFYHEWAIKNNYIK